MTRTFLAVATAAAALAQTPAAFEVASIRPHEGAIQFTGRSVTGSTINVTAYSVMDLIMDAYNVKEYQVDGAEGWAKLDRFDIAARMAGDSAPPAEQIRLMLQNLLTERFGLRLHRETREMPVFAVTLGKGGHKLKDNGSAGPMILMGRDGENSQLKFQGASLSAFAQQMTRVPGVGRPVLDKTGLTGNYDFQLTLAPFSIRVPPDPAAPAATGPSGESLFTAIEEQLGLKMEAQKAPIEILVIDHVERPSEN